MDKLNKDKKSRTKQLVTITITILGVLASIITIINYPLIKELWFVVFTNKDWKSCDSHYVVEKNHFTLKRDEEGKCSIGLQSGEYIVGTVDSGFQESIWTNMVTDRCAAFVLKGPLKLTFSMNIAGGGDFHYGRAYEEKDFQQKWKDLDNHPTCNQTSRGYDKIECNQSGCMLLN
jgi:hypothetical protein